MHWENKNVETGFIVTFTLLQWFGTEPTISLRYACTSVCMFVHVHVTCIYLYICMHTYVCICLHAFARVYISDIHYKREIKSFHHRN